MINKLYAQIKELRDLYFKGVNIIKHINRQKGDSINSFDAIKISYDLQSGSYVDYYKKHTEDKERYFQCIGNILNALGPSESMLEVGVGEGTTIANLPKYLHTVPKKLFGFDLSWSRIKHAKLFCERNGLKNIDLATGDLFFPPFKNESIDIVYTSHTLEPNGGREVEAIKALHKITKKYLVLFEPIYESATDKVKDRMRKNGYVKGLYKTAIDLGYNVIRHDLLDFSSDGMIPEDSYNPSGVIVIEKELDKMNNVKPVYACPFTKESLVLKDNYYTNDDGLLSYPIIGGTPCLNPENAILTTHHNTILGEF